MKKILLLYVVFIASILLVVAAKPDFAPATNNKAKNPVNLVIPAHAVELADGVFSLGTAQDVDGRTVEGFLFVDKQKENAKPFCGDGTCKGRENANNCPADCSDGGNGGGDPSPSTCFTTYGKGIAWKTTEDYIIATEVDSDATAASLDAWDSVVGFNIFGDEVAGTPNGSDEIRPDGRNEVEFASLGADDTIAFAIAWGIFRGPPRNRELVEWDVTFNSDYPFGDFNGSVEVMDYKNIATHEFGHALGLSHPADECTEETMFRFASFNETKKQTLEAGDLAGLAELYT